MMNSERKVKPSIPWLLPCLLLLCLAPAQATVTVALTPTSGSGYTGTFTFSATDTAGYADLADVQMYIGPTLTSTNTCQAVYWVSSNLIQSYTDTGSAGASAAPGSATTLANSQCSFALQNAHATKAGNTVSVTLPVTFQPWYSGAENVYVAGVTNGGSNSGWPKLGTWTATTEINIGAPTWTSIMTSSSKPWYFYYDNSTIDEWSPTNPNNIYSIPYTFPAPTSGTADVTSAVCTFPDTSPDAPPFWFDPVSPYTDWSGMAKTITDGNVYFDYPGSPGMSNSSFGLEFQAQFAGSWSSGSGDIIETTFWHQQRCFSGGLEYGFSYTLASNSQIGPPVFYYTTNSNCGIQNTTGNPPSLGYCHTANSYSSSFQNEDNLPGNNYQYPTHGLPLNNITFNGSPYQNQLLLYHAYVTPNASAPNGYQFQVEVTTANTYELVNCNASYNNTPKNPANGDSGNQSMSFMSKPCSFPIEPSGWFSIQTLYNSGTTGYVDTGVQRSNTIVTSPANLDFEVTSVKVGAH